MQSSTLVSTATTLEQFRDEIVDLIRVHAWQQTAFSDRLHGKRETATRAHAAKALETLAQHVGQITLPTL